MCPDTPGSAPASQARILPTIKGTHSVPRRLLGLCKSVTMERMEGRVAGDRSAKLLEAMDGVVNLSLVNIE
jgi:hypothetical protein